MCTCQYGTKPVEHYRLQTDNGALTLMGIEIFSQIMWQACVLCCLVAALYGKDIERERENVAIFVSRKWPTPINNFPLLCRSCKREVIQANHYAVVQRKAISYNMRATTMTTTTKQRKQQQ